MEVKDWITLASALIIACGWFVTAHLNRVKDIAQKKLEYRLKMFETFLPVWYALLEDKNALSKPEIQKQLNDARLKFALYGLKDEDETMSLVFSAIRNKDVEKLNESLNALAQIVQSRIRNELKINA